MNLQFEQTLASLNSKVQNICVEYGTTLKAFVASMDGAEQESNSEQVATVTEMRSLVEQTVLVLGQALNGLNYQRRTNILLGLIADPKKVKDLLKGQGEDMKDSKYLFGEKFHEYVHKVVGKDQQEATSPFERALFPSSSEEEGVGSLSEIPEEVAVAVPTEETTLTIEVSKVQSFKSGTFAKRKLLKYIHPIVLNLFPEPLQTVPLAGRLKFVQKN